MRSIIVLLRKDLRRFLHDKAAVSLTFIVPAVLIALFGQIFGVNKSSDGGPSGIPLGVVVEGEGPAAHDLLIALQAETAFRVISEVATADGTRRPLTEADARAGIKGDDYRFALILPADLVSAERLGLHLRFLSNPRNQIETQTVNGLLQKTIFTAVPQLLGRSLQERAKGIVGSERLTQFNHAMATNIASTFGGDPAEIERDFAAGGFGLGERDQPGDSSGASEFLNQLVNIETTQVAGAQVKNQYATIMVGGWAVQFLLFAVSASAVSLFEERKNGIFQRLLASPVTRGHILWSKFAWGALLGLVQLLTMFCMGRVLFGIEVEAHWFNLAVVSLFAAGACTSFGMLLAAVAPTPESARGLATFLILLMSAIGGAWFPSSMMPAFIQSLGKLTIVYWSIEGFIRVLWSGDTLVELLPILGILGAVTAVIMSISLWRFNKGNLFT